MARFPPAALGTQGAARLYEIAALDEFEAARGIPLLIPI